MTMPGVQMPHCAPPHLRNACCTGCRRRPGKPLDGAQRSSLGLEHRNQAAVHQLAIQQHGAGTALSFAAALLGSGKAQWVRKTSSRRSMG
jgi:hypothetical protein